MSFTQVQFQERVLPVIKERFLDKAMQEQAQADDFDADPEGTAGGGRSGGQDSKELKRQAAQEMQYNVRYLEDFLENGKLSIPTHPPPPYKSLKSVESSHATATNLKLKTENCRRRARAQLIRRRQFGSSSTRMRAGR